MNIGSRLSSTTRPPEIWMFIRPSEFAKIYFRYRKFSHDVTAPTLVSQTNPVGMGLFPYEALPFDPIHLHGYRRRDWKRSIEARSDFGKKVPNGAWTQSSRSEYSPTTPVCVSRYWKMEEKFALMENLTKFLWEDALSKSGLLKRVNRHHAIVREALGTRYKRGQQFSIAWNVAACIVVNFTAWRDHVRFIWKKKLQLALHMTINCWQRVESAQIRIGMQLVFQRKMTFLTRLRDISVLFAGIICGGYRKYSKPM